jgi:hypothetical protein
VATKSVSAAHPDRVAQACQRYWTAGGALRAVRPGARRRRSSASQATLSETDTRLGCETGTAAGPKRSGSEDVSGTKVTDAAWQPSAALDGSGGSAEDAGRGKRRSSRRVKKSARQPADAAAAPAAAAALKLPVGLAFDAAGVPAAAEAAAAWLPFFAASARDSSAARAGVEGAAEAPPPLAALPWPAAAFDPSALLYLQLVLNAQASAVAARAAPPAGFQPFAGEPPQDGGGAQQGGPALLPPSLLANPAALVRLMALRAGAAGAQAGLVRPAASVGVPRFVEGVECATRQDE